MVGRDRDVRRAVLDQPQRALERADRGGIAGSVVALRRAEVLAVELVGPVDEVDADRAQGVTVSAFRSVAVPTRRSQTGSVTLVFLREGATVTVAVIVVAST